MQNSVQQQMGNYSLTFVWVSSDRKMFNFANSSKPAMMTHSKWKKIENQMPRGFNNFALLTRTIPATSESRASFDILGVHSVFSDKEELQTIGSQYWDRMDGIHSDWEKLQTTLSVANEMKKWYDEYELSDYYNSNTHHILELLAEGKHKEAKAFMKGIV